MAFRRGTAGEDTLYGTAGSDSIYGYGGNDTLFGLGGRDSIDGGSGDDWIVDGYGANTIQGGDGDDYIFAGVTEDYETPDTAGNLVRGGNGEDAIYVGRGNDTVFGGNGDDDLDSAGGHDRLSGDAGNDYISFDAAVGSAGVDAYGGAGNDRLFLDTFRPGAVDLAFGGSGDDGLDIGAARDGSRLDRADWLFGGAGYDVLSYQGPTDTVGLFVDLAANVLIRNGEVHDVIGGFEGVQSGALGDTLIGTDGANRLNGNVGADTIEGGAGNDYLLGSSGADRVDAGSGDDVVTAGDDASVNTLTGGEGKDTYVYSFFGDPASTYNFAFYRTANGNDIITDFVVGEDKIWLSRSGFFDYGNYSPTETLRDELFVRNADGHATRDGGPQLVQNSTTGIVYWDSDGTGSMAAVKLCQVDPSVELTNTDFLYGSFLG